MPDPNFPLPIEEKTDHPDKLQLLKGVLSKFFYSAAEIKLIIDAVNHVGVNWEEFIATNDAIKTGIATYSFQTLAAATAHYQNAATDPKPKDGSIIRLDKVADPTNALYYWSFQSDGVTYPGNVREAGEVIEATDDINSPTGVAKASLLREIVEYFNVKTTDLSKDLSIETSTATTPDTTGSIYIPVTLNQGTSYTFTLQFDVHAEQNSLLLTSKSDDNDVDVNFEDFSNLDMTTTRTFTYTPSANVDELKLYVLYAERSATATLTVELTNSTRSKIASKVDSSRVVDELPKDDSTNLIMSGNVKRGIDDSRSYLESYVDYETTDLSKDLDIETSTATTPATTGSVYVPTILNQGTSYTFTLTFSDHVEQNALLLTSRNKRVNVDVDFKNLSNLDMTTKQTFTYTPSANVDELKLYVLYAERSATATLTVELTNSTRSKIASKVDSSRVVDELPKDDSTNLIMSKNAKRALDSKADKEEVDSEFESLKAVKNIKIFANDNYVMAFTDAVNRFLFGVTKDGTLEVSKHNFVTHSQLADLPSSSVKTLSNDEYLLAFVDSAKRLLGGWKRDGTFYVSKHTFNSVVAIIQVNCWGDSQTAGSYGSRYTDTLRLLLGNGFSINNYAVGGENVPTIAARQGGVAAIISISFTIPADLSKVEISSESDIRMRGSWSLGGNTIKPLKQDGHIETVNPCYIQGVECTMTLNRTTSTWYLQRNKAGDAKVIPANSTITFKGAQVNDSKGIDILFMGQNGGWSDDPSVLVEFYKAMIQHSNNDKYIIIGMTSGTAAERADLESALLEAFSVRYINLREYLVNYGLADAGLPETAQDTLDISVGSTPTSLRADPVHLNAAADILLANLINQRLIQLNYINI